MAKEIASPSPEANGQEATPAPEMGQADLMGQEAVSFYDYTHPDGQKEVFKDRQALDTWLKGSFERQSDYTRKTQSLAELRKKLEADQKALEEARQGFSKKEEEFKSFDNFLLSRPDVAQRLRQEMGRIPSPDVAVQRSQRYTDDTVKQMDGRLKELEAELNENKLVRQKEALYETLSQEPGFNRDKVEEVLNELGTGELEKVVRIAHLAARGQLGPQEMEQRALASAKEKAESRVMPSSGSVPVTNDYTPKNFDEAEQLAQAQYK